MRPLERIITRSIEKLPLVVFQAAAAALVAYFGQLQTGTMATFARSSIGERGVECRGRLRHLSRGDPADRSRGHYPYPTTGTDAWKVVAAVAVLLAITAVAIARGAALLTVGWLCISFSSAGDWSLQVGNQAFADRFVHPPSA